MHAGSGSRRPSPAQHFSAVARRSGPDRRCPVGSAGRDSVASCRGWLTVARMLSSWRSVHRVRRDDRVGPGLDPRCNRSVARSSPRHRRGGRVRSAVRVGEFEGSGLGFPRDCSTTPMNRAVVGRSRRCHGRRGDSCPGSGELAAPVPLGQVPAHRTERAAMVAPVADRAGCGCRSGLFGRSVHLSR